MSEAPSTRLCPFCKGDVVLGAVKCRSCGEWVSGDFRLSEAGILCLALVVGELLVMVVMAVQWLPTMDALFADFGSALPTLTEIVLHGVWMPFWISVLVVHVIASFVLTKRIRLRLLILVLALGIGFIVLAFTWWAVYWPLQPLTGAIAV